MRAERCVCGGGCFIHTPAPPSTPPSPLSCNVMRVMEAVRAVMMDGWMDGLVY